MRLATIAGVLSIGASIALSVVMDAILVWQVSAVPVEIAIATILFTATVILLSAVGAIIEWRRPGHAIGRLLMLGGPLYAFLGLSWLSDAVLKQLVDPMLFQLVFWGSSALSWVGMAIIVAWIPLLFPTGTLPGPRWRVPAIGLSLLFGISLGILYAQTSPWFDGGEPRRGNDLAMLVTLELVALAVLGGAAVITRYRRGDAPSAPRSDGWARRSPSACSASPGWPSSQSSRRLKGQGS